MKIMTSYLLISDLEIIDSICNGELYVSTTEFIRDAIVSFIELLVLAEQRYAIDFINEEIERIEKSCSGKKRVTTLNIPTLYINILNRLIIEGYFHNLSESIRVCCRYFIERRFSILSRVKSSLGLNDVPQIECSDEKQQVFETFDNKIYLIEGEKLKTYKIIDKEEKLQKIFSS